MMIKTTRRKILQFSAMGASVPLLSACFQEDKKTAEAANLTPEQLAFSDGDPEASVVMQEFLSLTCPHCASFHVNGYPLLKDKYIDKGQLLLVYRDFPLDGMALRGAMLVRALPPQQGIKLQNILLEQQRAWANREGDLTQLKNFARLAGLSPQQIEDTVDNQEKIDAIVAERQAAVDDYGVSGTPSFVIGKDLFGGGSFDDIIDWAGSYIA